MNQSPRYRALNTAEIGTRSLRAVSAEQLDFLRAVEQAKIEASFLGSLSKNAQSIRESVSHFVSRYLAREERNRFARDLLRASWLHQKHLVEEAQERSRLQLTERFRDNMRMFRENIEAQREAARERLEGQLDARLLESQQQVAAQAALHRFCTEPTLQHVEACLKAADAEDALLNGFVSGAAHAARREAVRCAFARVQKKVDARPEVQPAYRAAALQLEDAWEQYYLAEMTTRAMNDFASVPCEGYLRRWDAAARAPPTPTLPPSPPLPAAVAPLPPLPVLLHPMLPFGLAPFSLASLVPAIPPLPSPPSPPPPPPAHPPSPLPPMPPPPSPPTPSPTLPPSGDNSASLMAFTVAPPDGNATSPPPQSPSPPPPPPSPPPSPPIAGGAARAPSQDKAGGSGAAESAAASSNPKVVISRSAQQQPAGVSPFEVPPWLADLCASLLARARDSLATTTAASSGGDEAAGCSQNLPPGYSPTPEPAQKQVADPTSDLHDELVKRLMTEAFRRAERVAAVRLPWLVASFLHCETAVARESSLSAVAAAHSALVVADHEAAAVRRAAWEEQAAAECKRRAEEEAERRRQAELAEAERRRHEAEQAAAAERARRLELSVLSAFAASAPGAGAANTGSAASSAGANQTAAAAPVTTTPPVAGGSGAGPPAAPSAPSSPALPTVVVNALFARRAQAATMRAGATSSPAASPLLHASSSAAALGVPPALASTPPTSPASSPSLATSETASVIAATSALSTSAAPAPPDASAAVGAPAAALRLAATTEEPTPAPAGAADSPRPALPGGGLGVLMKAANKMKSSLGGRSEFHINPEMEALLKEGATFLRHQPKGRPVERFIRLSADLTQLECREKPTSKKVELLPASAIYALSRGQGTPIFQRKSGQPNRESVSFSLLATEGRTIDLEATGGPAQYDRWVRAFEYLIERSRTPPDARLPPLDSQQQQPQP